MRYEHTDLFAGVELPFLTWGLYGAVHPLLWGIRDSAIPLGSILLHTHHITIRPQVFSRYHSNPDAPQCCTQAPRISAFHSHPYLTRLHIQSMEHHPDLAILALHCETYTVLTWDLHLPLCPFLHPVPTHFPLSSWKRTKLEKNLPTVFRSNCLPVLPYPAMARRDLLPHPQYQKTLLLFW